MTSCAAHTYTIHGTDTSKMTSLGGAYFDERDQKDDHVQSLAEHVTALPPFRLVSPVHGRLAASVTADKDGLHTTVTKHTTHIHDQMVEGNSLHDRTIMSRRSLKDLSGGWDIAHLDIKKALRLAAIASRHQAAYERQVLAQATAAAVQRIRETHNAFGQVENAVWSGTTVDESTALNLTRMDLALGEEQYRSSVEQALEQQHLRLRSMVIEQISSAWKQAVRIETTLDGLPAVVVQRNVVLKPPSSQAITMNLSASSGHRCNNVNKTPTPYTLHAVCQSLETLGVLSQLLRDLHSRLMREVFEPLMSSSTWVPTQEQHEGDTCLLMKTTSVQSPSCVASNVKVALAFVQTSLPTTCGEFTRRLQQSAFELVLHTTLVPAIPSTSLGLADWMRLLRQASRWEDELLDGNGGSTTVFGSFLRERAGHVWLDKKRNAILRLARRLAFDEWASWRSHSVTPSSPPKSEAVGPIITIDEDGWGFDDEQPGEVERSADAVPSAPNASGWGFDDERPQAHTESPIVKPAREAKRLAKRVGSKAQPTAPSQLQLSHAAPPDHIDGSTTSPPVSFDASYRVSEACNGVVSMAATALEEMSAVATLCQQEPSFANVPREMSTQLAEALDLLRASIPVAHSSVLNGHLEIGLQLSNDYLYLSEQLAQTLVDISWVKRDQVVQSFKEASVVAFEGCVSRQNLSILSKLKGISMFSNCGDDIVYAEAVRAMQGLVADVETIAGRVSLFVGQVVESMVGEVIASVLALEDISEEDSKRIGNLLQHFEVLQRLFRPDANNVSTIAAFVPHWIKLSYLNKLLAANLAEITRLFENGSLVDFSPNELGILVRALFADSPKRATLLDEIEQ